MSFESLGLRAELLSAIAAQGYTTPTPIQAEAIPVIFEGGDLLAGAQTGTGKTAAFALPIVQMLGENVPPDKRRRPRALVLVPTRELAAQVSEQMNNYARRLSLRSTMIYGGVTIQAQIERLHRGVDIVVATPGRLLDHAERGTVNLSRIKFLVLDEAGRMLDLGFIDDIHRVAEYLPAKRQTLLFSATYSKEIKQLADELLDHPRRIEVARRNKSQSIRTRTLAEFKRGEFRVLVATDVAARGLDIERLPHVVNYDLPQVPEDYVHRIGRTGRAGEDGVALSLVSREEQPLLAAIEKLLKYAIPRRTLAEFPRFAVKRVGKPKDTRKTKQPCRARKTPELPLNSPAKSAKTREKPEKAAAKARTPRSRKVVAERPAPKTGRRGSRSKP